MATTGSKDKDKAASDFEEFDSGIDVGTLSAEERAIYDKLNTQVRNAYLKKTSKLAEQRKAWEQEQAGIKGQLDEATQALQAWQQWYTNEGQYMTPAQQQRAMDAQGLENPNEVQQEIAGLRREFQQAATQYNNVIQKLQEQLQQSNSALELQTRLYDLRFKHPDMDPMRVLETAKDRGIQDMDLAYQLAYGDELRKQQVDKEVEVRVAEEKAKLESEKAIVDTTPSTTRYAPPAEAKTYADAGKNLLNAVRAGGGGTIT